MSRTGLYGVVRRRIRCQTSASVDHRASVINGGPKRGYDLGSVRYYIIKGNTSSGDKRRYQRRLGSCSTVVALVLFRTIYHLKMLQHSNAAMSQRYIATRSHYTWSAGRVCAAWKRGGADLGLDLDRGHSSVFMPFNLNLLTSDGDVRSERKQRDERSARYLAGGRRVNSNRLGRDCSGVSTMVTAVANPETLDSGRSLVGQKLSMLGSWDDQGQEADQIVSCDTFPSRPLPFNSIDSAPALPHPRRIRSPRSSLP